MLTHSKTVGFLATSVPEQSKHFYNTLLGLTVVEETPYAIVLASINTTIRIQITEKAVPPPYTTLGWEVNDIDSMVRTLSDAGLTFERFDGLDQDDLGVWAVPGGAKVAWFKDPDGNLLSLTQKTG